MERAWRRTSESPEAYSSGECGLALLNGRWILAKVIGGAYREVSRTVSAKPPFAWADKIIDDVTERRGKASWTEKVIHGRPGEEDVTVKIPKGF